MPPVVGRIDSYDDKSCGRVVWIGVLLTLVPSAVSAEVALREREPIWFALHLPAQQFASASASEIVEIADRAIRRTTDFKVKLVPESIVDTCAAQGSNAVGCLVRALERDTRFLLMVSTIDESHLVSLLVDLKQADQILRESASEEQGNEAVAGKAVVSATLPTEIRDQMELDGYLAGFLTGELAALFERAGARTLGGVQIALPSAPTSAQISLDGTGLGSHEGPLTIRDVPAGWHVLRIERDGFTPWESRIEVKPLELQAVTVELEPTAIAFNRNFRQALRYGGLAVAASGAALAVASVFDDSAVCIGGAACPASYIRKTTLPFGYSLIGMGAAWSVGAWLGDEEAFPWIELVAGMVVFGVSYGVSWAVDGRCRRNDCIDLTER